MRIIERLKEPSSWAGLAIFAASISGHTLDSDTAQDIGMIASGVMAALAIFLPERK